MASRCREGGHLCTTYLWVTFVHLSYHYCTSFIGWACGQMRRWQTREERKLSIVTDHLRGCILPVSGARPCYSRVGLLGPAVSWNDPSFVSSYRHWVRRLWGWVFHWLLYHQHHLCSTKTRRKYDIPHLTGYIDLLTLTLLVFLPTPYFTLRTKVLLQAYRGSLSCRHLAYPSGFICHLFGLVCMYPMLFFALLFAPLVPLIHSHTAQHTISGIWYSIYLRYYHCLLY